MSPRVCNVAPALCAITHLPRGCSLLPQGTPARATAYPDLFTTLRGQCPDGRRGFPDPVTFATEPRKVLSPSLYATKLQSADRSSSERASLNGERTLPGRRWRPPSSACSGVGSPIR